MYPVQGDNGFVVPFVIRDSQITSLEGATVSVAIKRGDNIITKPVDIINASTGKCQFVLTSLDLTIVGVYKYQWTVEFEDGRIKSDGKMAELYVKERLAGDPVVTVIVDGGTF
jgi:BppU N-terminal domain